MVKKGVKILDAIPKKNFEMYGSDGQKGLSHFEISSPKEQFKIDTDNDKKE
jgi:hypothetical protein